jgi:enoyl-[acyl-carrier protein] reductase I
MSGILEGKRILIIGVLMESSIAFRTAKPAQEQGA